MANKLGIAQNTYSKIETNQTKLTTETLQKIAEVLEISPMDIMSQQPAIINMQPNQGTQNAIGHVDNFITGQKELYEQIIAGKDKEIERLEKLVEMFMEQSKRK
jgi:transcriptional regulator with XRE-family HTH domain